MNPRHPKLEKLRLERLKMHAAIFALGVTLGAYRQLQKAPEAQGARPSTMPPSAEGGNDGH